MATIEELKRRCDLRELARWLGLKQGPGGAKANWFRPGKTDEANPSLSIFEKNGAQGWKDWAEGKGGSAVDLVMHVRGCDTREAVKLLHEHLQIPLERRQDPEPARERSRAEWIAD